MKKLTVCLMTSFLLLTCIPIQLKAGTESPMIPVKTVESAEAGALITRLEEINLMDKSRLSSLERKQLRKEVRSIKSHLKELGGGIYLSVGAIIIIILLLILLL